MESKITEVDVQKIASSIAGLCVKINTETNTRVTTIIEGFNIAVIVQEKESDSSLFKPPYSLNTCLEVNLYDELKNIEGALLSIAKNTCDKQQNQ